MKYLIALLILLSGCGYNLKPDTTTVDYTSTANGDEKIKRGIKQTFKWSK